MIALASSLGLMARTGKAPMPPADVFLLSVPLTATLISVTARRRAMVFAMAVPLARGVTPRTTLCVGNRPSPCAVASLRLPLSTPSVVAATICTTSFVMLTAIAVLGHGQTSAVAQLIKPAVAYLARTERSSGVTTCATILTLAFADPTAKSAAGLGRPLMKVSGLVIPLPADAETGGAPSTEFGMQSHYVEIRRVDIAKNCSSYER